MPLSLLARELALARYARWIELGCPGRPWIRSHAHEIEPVRPREPPPPLSPRWDFLKRANKEWYLRESALGLVLDEVRRCDLRVSGIIPPGQRVGIDSVLLPQLVFDLEHDTARTADGSLRWQALEVAPAAPPPAPAGSISPKCPVRIPKRQRDFLRWYRTAYPDGHPAGKKLETLAHEAAGALACRISTRTIRRALSDRALADRSRADRGQRTKLAR